MKKLTIVGFVITVLWLAAFSFILVSKWSEAGRMGLNEWGDFLAGLTAPIALIWIVIGYFQQGQELHVNTEALKAQQKELSRQVEETAILARNSDRQAQAAEQAVELSRADRLNRDIEDWLRRKIKLKVDQGVMSSHGASRIVFQNIGQSLSHVAIGMALSDFTLKGGANLHTGDKLKLKWPASKPYPIDIVLAYVDSAGRKRRAEFVLTDKGELVEQAETDQDGNPYYE